MTRAAMRRQRADIIVAALLHAAAANAADAPKKAKPPASTPASSSAFTWAGGYVGASMGAGVPPRAIERLRPAAGGLSPNAFDLFAPSRERAGLTFGALAGYNWQTSNLVYGLETELSFLDGRRGPSGIFPAPPAYGPLGVASYSLEASQSGTYFASLRGRLGLAADRWLLYLTGGAATGGWRGASTLMLHGPGGGVLMTPVSQSSRMKYALGAGVEYALDEHWSARGEYLFLNQSYNTQIFDGGAGAAYVSRAWSESHVLRFGVTYRFAETGAAAAKDEEEAKDAKPRTANKKAAAKMDEKKERQESKKGESKNGESKTDSEDKKPANGEKAEAPAPEQVSVHGQATSAPQGYPKFRALYSGPNSFRPPQGQARDFNLVDAFLGLRLWEGGEAYVTPEIQQGFGLSESHGVAGFPSAMASKIGRAAPYLRFQRYFLRQTIGLGGKAETIEAGPNQLAGSADENRLTFTIGRFAVTDIFDDNKYAHDPMSTFMNISIISMGAFDYAADAWGYTHGATLEWKQDWWTARAGVFQLSDQPNSEKIEPVLFRQFMPAVELEARYSLLEQPGKIKLLGYADYGRFSKVDDVVALAFATGNFPPDVSNLRMFRVKAGAGVNVEQQISKDLGFFLRASVTDGRYETIDFLDIDRSIAGGFSLAGTSWGRPKDTIGIAGAANGLSGSRVRYFALGGTSIFIGDGALSYGGEHILETYYKFHVMDGVHLTADYQFVDHPAYNRDRGPVSLFALRLHGEF